MILCDFGEAVFGAQKYGKDVMPDPYRAPEIVMHQAWDAKIDIWGAAMTVGRARAPLEVPLLTQRRSGPYSKAETYTRSRTRTIRAAGWRPKPPTWPAPSPCWARRPRRCPISGMACATSSTRMVWALPPPHAGSHSADKSQEISFRTSTFPTSRLNPRPRDWRARRRICFFGLCGGC